MWSRFVPEWQWEWFHLPARLFEPFKKPSFVAVAPEPLAFSANTHIPVTKQSCILSSLSLIDSDVKTYDQRTIRTFSRYLPGMRYLLSSAVALLYFYYRCLIICACVSAFLLLYSIISSSVSSRAACVQLLVIMSMWCVYAVSEPTLKWKIKKLISARPNPLERKISAPPAVKHRTETLGRVSTFT